MQVRDLAAGAIRPFDQHQRFVGKHVVPTEIRQLSWRVEPIEIEMVYGRAGRCVAVDDRERWAGHVLRDAVSATDRLHERRLPRPYIATNRHDEWGRRGVAQSLAPGDQVGAVESEM